ncbi:hypothetical protein KO488_08330 [Poseidonibacter lekithochrous]|uniref:hypothetical protein n=1 Tax=Poseidonibacter TaxID=2321187 RepID=UPI001C089A8A|nr:MULTISPECIES: hypothetical protein [Poseidonibacter]MBU3014761.1 hypothetical protein [Poseidonibacter lekithochrous]MDO6828059.1 hypothetical protein [Poseidonibacter sp. 1_MG-2023]
MKNLLLIISFSLCLFGADSNETAISLGLTDFDYYFLSALSGLLSGSLISLIVLTRI